MSQLVLIDSSAWLFILGKRPLPVLRERVTDLFEKNLAAITSPIMFELLSYPLAEGSAQELIHFLSTLHIFPFDPSDWDLAAHWAAGLRKKGLKIKAMDALIGYMANKHHLVLLHADADLDRLSRYSSLRVESYVQDARRWSRA